MILITGAAGQIGRDMIKTCLARGMPCIGIDYVDNPSLPEHAFVKLDVREPVISSLIKERGFDSVIHLAFCTKAKMTLDLRNDIDLNGSKNIISCAAAGGVKNIVFMSSGRVYGDKSKPGGSLDINGKYLNPMDDLYGQNKIKAENLFLDAARQHGFKLAILRIATVCWDGGGAGMPDMLRSTAKTGKFMTFGDKNPPVQLVHAEDVVNAALNAIGKEGIFDVASEGTMTMHELYAEAARIGGKVPSHIKLPLTPVVLLTGFLWKLGIAPMPPLYVKMGGYDITQDISKTIEVLGRPKHTIREILEGIVKG